MVRFRKNKDRHLNPVPDLPPSDETSRPVSQPSHSAGKAVLRLAQEGEATEPVRPSVAESSVDSRIDILDTIIDINERLKNTPPDANVYKLEQVFLLLAQMASSERSIEDIVGDDEFGSGVDSMETVYTAARLYDGLEALKAAFEYARSDSHTGRRNAAGVTRFTNQVVPTPAWEDPVAKDLILRGVDDAYLLCRQTYHRYSNSIDGFIDKMQNVLAEHGMRLPLPPESAQYVDRRNHEISKQRIIDEAWEDWAERRSGR